MLGRDPDARVFDRNYQLSAGVDARTDRDFPLRFGKFYTIRQEVSHDLSKFRLIDMDECCGVRGFALDLNRFLMGNRIDGADCRLNQFSNTNELLLKIDLARFDSRKIKQPIYNV